jgi:hypothetical protein
MKVGDVEISEIESIDVQDGDPCAWYAWCVLRDGRQALWNYSLTSPPGEAQTLRIVESH